MSDIKSVTSLGGAGPSENVVALLEGLLVEARDGKIRGVAVALDMVREGSRDVAKEAGGDWLVLLAELDLLMADVRAILNERSA